MRLSKFVKTYQDEIPYYLGVATAVFLAWLAYWAVTTPKPHERRSQKTEPIIQAYVDKHGATNRFLCDNVLIMSVLRQMRWSVVVYEIALFEPVFRH